MSLMTPETGLLFWMLLSFGVVFVILARYGWPVITGMVDRRRAYIEDSLRSADEANARLENIRTEADTLLSEARQRQIEIVRDANALAEKIVAEARDKARETADGELKAAREQIEQQKREAIRDIRTQVALLSVEVAERVLREKLGGSADEQRDMIMRLLDEAKTDRRES